MSAQRYDLAVIGGGPGGYVAAIRAAQLGMRVVLIEREHLGGICSNWGCIPTKALLHAADVYREIGQAAELGIKVSGLSFDFAQIIARSRTVAAKMNGGVRHLLKKNKVKVIEGSGKLAGGGGIEVAVHGSIERVQATYIILATGARPTEIPGLPADGKRIWNYRHALAPQGLPASLLIVGAGAIGMEFASFYATFGARVTIVETQDRVLPGEDRDVSAFVQAEFEKQGIEVLTGARIAQATVAGDGVDVTLENGSNAAGKTAVRRVDAVLVAAGITGNTENLGLEKTKVELDKGNIVTDAHCATAEPGVFAIGDVSGPPWLAHKASHEAVACVEYIHLGESHGELDRTRIPACTYSHPQVASVGLTEEEALRRGHTCRVGRFPFVGNGKATALGETSGFVKTIFDRTTGELLGAHLAGAGVTELIHGLTIARTLETTEAELMQTIFPHPTLSEATHESVLMAFERAMHI
jgi:dihydrolipoamide dehydrogenase